MRQRLERPAQQHSKHMLLNALLQKEARGQWKRSRPPSEPTRRAKHFRRSRQCSQEEQKSLWAQDGVSQKVEGTAQQLSENMRLNALQKNPLGQWRRITLSSKAHKKGKTMKEIAAMLPGRTECAVRGRWNFARHQGHCTAALVAYAAEFTPSEKTSPWSPEEDQTFIRAHKEGKTSQEIAAMLPGRTEIAVQSRWNHAKRGTHSSAPLLAYAAENN